MRARVRQIDRQGVMLDIEQFAPEQAEKWQGKDLDVDIKIHRNKRSLSANAYFYVLIQKIAERVKISTTAVHNMMLRDYGYIDPDLPIITLDADVDYLELDILHLRRFEITEDGRISYHVVRGSHTYNTEEMAHLIDMTVAEAKELGIETMTPNELERMKSLWQAQGRAPVQKEQGQR